MQCYLYEQGKAIGSLCAPLCISRDIHSLTCHSFQAAKEAVFSAEWHNIKLVFKSVSSDIQPIRWFDNGILKYPNEKEFLYTIRTIVKRKLNLTLAYDTAVRLARLKPSYEEKDVLKRRLEMEILWQLLQDNEYLLSTIFTDKDVFPQLIGTCGPYFAVEYMEPAPFSQTSTIFTMKDTLEEWGQRLKFAIQILDLLDELDNSFREPFHLCNIKLDHFGYTVDRKKLKFVDLDETFPSTIINSLIQQIPNCERDEDCEFLDCRSFCNRSVHKCYPSVTNNNLQIVCEKLFLGWRLSNTVIVPGLLMSQHTPSELASILRQCANPDGSARRTPDDEVRKRLYNILSEVDQSVNNDFFL